MGTAQTSPWSPSKTPAWRYAMLAMVALGAFLLLLIIDPILQDPEYHAFADTRTFYGIPKAFDVLSNLAFLIVGILGLGFCLRAEIGSSRNAWMTFFAGVALVSFGSAYYHLNPDNPSLVWDRLPMTIAFMGFFTALLGDYVNPRFGTRFLIPAVLIGIGSVLYWHWTDDLRPYVWVQFVPLLAVPVILLPIRSGASSKYYLIAALGWYILAKVAELFDLRIFQTSGELISGHTLKHLLAAVGCYCVYLMLKKREGERS